MPDARRWCFAAALALPLLLAPALAHACQCAQPVAPIRTAIAEAALIVEARVDTHAYVIDRGFVTTLTVTRIHKGTSSAQLELHAAKTCAFAFEPGHDYLVYAHADGNVGFAATFCTRTRALGEAKADLAVLARRGRATTPPPATTPPLATPTPPAIALSFAWSTDPVAQLLRLFALAELALR